MSPQQHTAHVDPKSDPMDTCALYCTKPLSGCRFGTPFGQKSPLYSRASSWEHFFVRQQKPLYFDFSHKLNRRGQLTVTVGNFRACTIVQPENALEVAEVRHSSVLASGANKACKPGLRGCVPPNGRPGTRVRIVRIVRLHFQPGSCLAWAPSRKRQRARQTGMPTLNLTLGDLTKWAPNSSFIGEKIADHKKSKAKKKMVGCRATAGTDPMDHEAGETWRNPLQVWYYVESDLSASPLLSDHRK